MSTTKDHEQRPAGETPEPLTPTRPKAPLPQKPDDLPPYPGDGGSGSGSTPTGQ